MKFRIELRDSAFNIIDILDDKISDLSWAYSRIGGCGEFSFKAPRKLISERAMTGEFNVRIYKRADVTGTYTLWYQGLIEQKSSSLAGNKSDVDITGHGYLTQLSRIYLNNITYTSTEVSLIVKNILDNYVIPNTNISYSVSDLETTSFTIDSIKFNETARSAIEKLANIVGTREWGVDKNRSFFFKARATTVGYIFQLGANVTNFKEDQNFSEIINQVIVQGAQTGGTYYTAGPYTDSASKLKYNLRTSMRQNSSINTSTVAAQFATATLAEFSEASKKASCELVNYETQIEATNPLNLFQILTNGIKYGQKRYGTFLYSGTVSRNINRINYSLSNNNSLKVKVDLGQLRPTLSEDIAQLEYELDQQRSASL